LCHHLKKLRIKVWWSTMPVQTKQAQQNTAEHTCYGIGFQAALPLSQLHMNARQTLSLLELPQSPKDAALQTGVEICMGKQLTLPRACTKQYQGGDNQCIIPPYHWDLVTWFLNQFLEATCKAKRLLRNRNRHCWLLGIPTLLCIDEASRGLFYQSATGLPIPSNLLLVLPC
jgi:hypothetical protein